MAVDQLSGSASAVIGDTNVQLRAWVLDGSGVRCELSCNGQDVTVTFRPGGEVDVAIAPPGAVAALHSGLLRHCIAVQV